MMRGFLQIIEVIGGMRGDSSRKYGDDVIPKGVITMGVGVECPAR